MKRLADANVGGVATVRLMQPRVKTRSLSAPWQLQVDLAEVRLQMLALKNDTEVLMADLQKRNALEAANGSQSGTAVREHSM